MGKYLQVFTTVDDREKAELIADRLVEKRLAACEEIRSLHSYEIPEIVASPIVFGNRSYLAWIDDNLMGTNDGAEKDKF